MSPLNDAILDIASNTPPDSVDQLAALVKAGASLQAWPANASARARVQLLQAAWHNQPISRDELAGALIGACAAYRSARAEEVVELVWTGPPSALVATRKTEQALLQVIDAAKARLFMTSFVAYNVASILQALQEAVSRDVQLSILLEASDQHGGTISIDAIGKMKLALPSARMLSWANKGEGFDGGKVHAKCAVADERICFISSANLTSHAMEKNMEAGILITGGQIPLSLHRHLDALLTTGVIEKV